MGKFLTCLGFVILIGMFLFNRLSSPLTDGSNIILGIFAAIFMLLGIFIKDKEKIHLNSK